MAPLKTGNGPRRQSGDADIPDVGVTEDERSYAVIPGSDQRA